MNIFGNHFGATNGDGPADAAGWQRAASFFAFAKPKTQLTDAELKEIGLLWLDLLIEFEMPLERAVHTPGRLSFELSGDRHISIDHNGIELDDDGAAQDDNAIRATLEYFKLKSPREPVQLEGSDEFKLRSWIQAQVVGIQIAGYSPKPGEIDNAEIAIDIDLDRPAEGRLRAWINAKLQGHDVKGYAPTQEELAAVRITTTFGARTEATMRPVQAEHAPSP
jgi:hypothetical protein